MIDILTITLTALGIVMFFAMLLWLCWRKNKRLERMVEQVRRERGR